MSRNHGSPITEEIVREFLDQDLALYSLSMPGDITTASILCTYQKPLCTFYEIIELDDVFQACAEYLIRTGAPVFADVDTVDAYTDELERQLRLGLAPAAARAAALRACGLHPAAETPAA